MQTLCGTVATDSTQLCASGRSQKGAQDHQGSHVMHKHRKEREAREVRRLTRTSGDRAEPDNKHQGPFLFRLIRTYIEANAMYSD